MKKLLITLMLISPFSFADWGDEYRCAMTSHSKISIYGEKTDNILKVFTIKLNKAKNLGGLGTLNKELAAYWGDKSVMVINGLPDIGRIMEIQELSRVSEETWSASRALTTSFFSRGIFMLTSLRSNNIINIIGTCEKFK